VVYRDPVLGFNRLIDTREKTWLSIRKPERLILDIFKRSRDPIGYQRVLMER